MSNFVQTMKDWRRMCQYMERTHGDNSCDMCPLNGCSAVYEDDGQTDYADIQNKVDAWAAANPEPVYPTWIDVMKMYGVTDETGYCYLDSAYKPIPADIAEKLGIEPKEAKS